MAYTIIPRHDTAASFSALNRIYSKGELLLEEQLDGTFKLKVGDGVQEYNLLAYIGGAGGGGSNAFGSVVVSGQSSIVADTISDALTVAVGAGLTATTNETTDTLMVSPVYGTTTGTICQGNDSRLSVPIAAHASTHVSGGSDAIKLDALAAPDDTTTRNATTAAHGLLPKLSGSSTQYMSGMGQWTTPTGGGGATNAFGTVAVSGYADVVADAAPDTLTLVASNGVSISSNETLDTVYWDITYGTIGGTVCQGNDVRLFDQRFPVSHAATHRIGGSDTFKLDQMEPLNDVNSLNATTSAHGFLRKLNGSAAHFMDGTGEWSVPSGASLPFTDVTDYGAIGDNSTLNDTAFANAIAAMSGRLYFPAGIYRVAAAINLTKAGIYYGDGGTTHIRTTSNTADVFYVATPEVTICEMTFDSTGTRSGGSYVVLAAGETRLQAFKMMGAYNGVRVADVPGIAVVTIQEGHIRQTVSTGTLIIIQGGFDVSIRDIVSDSAPVSAIGILVTQVGDLCIEDCNLIHSDICLAITPDPGKVCASVQANNTFFDTSGTYGMVINGGSGSVVRCIFDQCWFSSAGSGGVLIIGNVDGIDFSACQMMLNGGDGIHIVSGAKNIGIIGGGFAQNAGAGISIDTGSQHVVVDGVRSGNTHGLSGNNYGIYVASGVSNYIIANCDLIGNSVANLADGGSAPKIVTGILS